MCSFIVHSVFVGNNAACIQLIRNHSHHVVLVERLIPDSNKAATIRSSSISSGSPVCIPQLASNRPKTLTFHIKITTIKNYSLGNIFLNLNKLQMDNVIDSTYKYTCTFTLCLTMYAFYFFLLALVLSILSSISQHFAS